MVLTETSVSTDTIVQSIRRHTSALIGAFAFNTPHRIESHMRLGSLILARFSVGRILLHLLAMVGDRCIRFHAAGIIRELPWFATAVAPSDTKVSIDTIVQ